MSEPAETTVVVVTGASGGIGRATCAAFLERGATVVGLDRTLPADGGVAGVEHRVVDVTDVARIRSTTDAIVEQYGHIDVWVNNAGSLSRTPSLDLEPEAWDATLDVNLRGTFFGAQAAARHMSERGSGSIVNLSSYAGIKARPNCADYAAAKAGIAHLTACLALEWGPLGIRVNCIAPGYVDTPMSAWMHADPVQKELLLGRTPIGRLGEPEDIARAVVYLAGEDASFVTGQVLLVDGGITKA